MYYNMSLIMYLYVTESSTSLMPLLPSADISSTSRKLLEHFVELISS